MNESAVPLDPIGSPVEPVRPSRHDPAATRQRWVDRVQRFRDSDLSVAQFCLAEGVSASALYILAPNARGRERHRTPRPPHGRPRADRATRAGRRGRAPVRCFASILARL